MEVDFASPLNEAVLRFLRDAGPAGKRDKSRAPQPDDFMGLGTHPDTVERLWNEITASLPERCQWVVYGSPVLVHPRRGVIFGWARGTHAYALRLPVEARKRALQAGAQTTHRYSNGKVLDLSKLGEEWVFGCWSESETEWCLHSYEYAGSRAES